MKKISLLALVSMLSVHAYALDAQSVVAKMDPEQVARLALMNQMGSCRMTAPVGASYKYRLSYINNGKLTYKYFYSLSVVPIKFNAIEVMELTPIQHSVKYNWWEKISNELFNNVAHAKAMLTAMPTYELAAYSQIDAKSQRYSAGNFIKNLVANGKCGSSITFETYKKSINQMSSVEFYRDATTNSIRCTDTGFVKKVRNPSGCGLLDVRSELPEKTCQLLYQVKTQKSKNSRVDSGNESSPSLSGAGVALAPLTEAIRADFAISKALNADPELASFTLSAEVPSLDEALPVSALEFLDSRAPKTAAEFTALSAADKLEVLNVLSTVEAIQGSAEYSGFSTRVTSLSAVKTAALAYAAANPTLALEGYAVPKKIAIEGQIATLTTPIRNLGMIHSLNLGCLEMIAAPINNLQAN